MRVPHGAGQDVERRARPPQIENGASPGSSPANATIALLLLPIISALVLLVLTPIMAQAAETGNRDVPVHRAAPHVPRADLPDIPPVELGRQLATQRCSNCHALEPGSDKTFAAPLYDLFGRRSGTMPGYQFSPNMKALGAIWTPKSLSEWLAATTFDTPDIRMRHVGLPEPRTRAALITYISTLRGNAPAPAR